MSKQVRSTCEYCKDQFKTTEDERAEKMYYHRSTGNVFICHSCATYSTASASIKTEFTRLRDVVSTESVDKLKSIFNG